MIPNKQSKYNGTADVLGHLADVIPVVSLRNDESVQLPFGVEVNIIAVFRLRFYGFFIVAEHKSWLQSIRHEHPSTAKKYNIGVYIRYFNQTKYDNYLSYHKKQFEDTIGLCPNWTLVDFYIDEGQSAPNMESAPEWSRLLCDAMDGKVDLILTQKVSNVSKKMPEVTFCSRLLARQNPPIGIYFISEDIYTLASYYQDDMRDTFFLPFPDWRVLPDSDAEARAYLEANREIT